MNETPCPICSNGLGQFLGCVGNRRQYRCDSCGFPFSKGIPTAKRTKAQHDEAERIRVACERPVPYGC